jgi:hypothetical protein
LKIKANRAGTSRLGYLIYRDSLLYFTFTTVTNIVVFAIQSLGSSHSLLKPNAVPFSTLVTVTMGSRVFLNLKLFHQREAQLNQGLPFGSQMSSENTRYDHRTRFTSAHTAIAVSESPARHPVQVKTGLSFTGYGASNHERSDARQ